MGSQRVRHDWVTFTSLHSPHSHEPTATSDCMGVVLAAELPQSWVLSPPWSSLGGEPGASECLGYLPPIPSEFSLNIHAVSYLTQSMTLDSLSSTICLFLWGHPPLSTSTIILLSRRPQHLRPLCSYLGSSISLTDDKSHTYCAPAHIHHLLRVHATKTSLPSFCWGGNWGRAPQPQSQNQWAEGPNLSVTTHPSDPGSKIISVSNKQHL